MSFGLKVWDAGGSVTLDSRDRITRLIGIFNVTPTSSRQYISVPGFRNDGTWAAIAYSGSVNISTSDNVVTYYRPPMNPFSFDAPSITITIVRF